MLLLKNNLKITWRNLWNNLGGSLLNITGLTLGVLGSIIIFLTVKYEVSFDQQHKNVAEIYRVTNNYYYPTFTMHVGNTPDPMAEALKTDFPAFKSVVPIYSSNNHNISVENEIFQSDIIYCGPEFIKTFDFYNDPSQWLIGNPTLILKDINKTILTETLATTLYGRKEDAIGKIITLRNETQVEVAGVMKDPPNNTNYPFEQLISFPTYAQFASDSYGNVGGTTTFVQLPASVNVESLKPTLDKFNKKYMETAWGEDFVSMDLQPLSAIHFDERFESDNYVTNKTYLWALGLIGLFMILIACINFVNLATAKAITRSKEIGMRKILGSSKKNIIGQFMSESFLLAFIAISLGTMLAQMSFPYFSELTNLNIGNDFNYSTDLFLFITTLLFFITFAMGLYPAVMLSNFQPLEVVRQKMPASPIKGLTLRRGLIAFQLTISQVLVIAAIVITYQLQFFQLKDLGFEKDSMLVVNMNNDATIDQKRTFKNKIKQFPFVNQVSLTSTIPMSGHTRSTGLTSKDSAIKDRFNVHYIYADNDYVDAMNMELLAGKNTVTQLEVDTMTRGYVVNETLVKRLDFGTPENAIGKNISLNGTESTIIGVVKDFHTLSLHEKIKPVALIYGVSRFNSMGINYKTTDIHQAIAQVEMAWQEVFPTTSLDYYFQNEQMGEMYNNEIRFAQIIKGFTLISIIIASIGLIGLSAFSSVKRFKEIGVRKVLGATVPNILYLMSKEFIGLTIVGFFLSIPIAYYLVSIWLEEFAYHINMEWWMIGTAGLLTLVLTLFTVGLQSIKAAVMNPIESLRSE